MLNSDRHGRRPLQLSELAPIIAQTEAPGPGNLFELANSGLQGHKRTRTGDPPSSVQVLNYKRKSAVVTQKKKSIYSSLSKDEEETRKWEIKGKLTLEKLLSMWSKIQRASPRSNVKRERRSLQPKQVCAVNFVFGRLQQFHAFTIISLPTDDTRERDLRPSSFAGF